MKKAVLKDIEVSSNVAGFEAAQCFVENLFENGSVSREIASEAMVVFEAVFSAIIMQCSDDTTSINIGAEDRLGDKCIRISYEGKKFTPPVESEGDVSPELRIMQGYADKISYSYHSGYNTIRISVRKSPRSYFLSCGIAILLAMVVYLPMSFLLDIETRHALIKDYVFPLEQLFANAMLMVGTPVTLFSLLKNASNTFIIAGRSSDAGKLQAKSIITSVFAIFLAIFLSVVLSFAFSGWRGYYPNYGGGSIEFSFADVVASMVPSSILDPFDAISPIPLIVVALLVTYALCSTVNSFGMLKNAMDACYDLFSRMLSAVMALLPFFCFLAILDVLLENGFVSFLLPLVLILLVMFGIAILLGSYALRLLIKGVDVRAFAKELIPLLRENFAIGSVIEAVPYNVRYCTKHFGLDRRWLETRLSILSQINLDGNCFIIMFIAMFYIYVLGIGITWINIAVIALLVLFLSFGAPNQPGSILIGTLIILTYLNSYEMLSLAFYLEVFLGGVQNIINVISSVVTVVEESQKL